MRFLVLSTSDIKKTAFAEWRGEADFVDVIDEKRPEQPIAKTTADKQYLLRMRLDAYMSTHPECFDTYDYLLSIENMIMFVHGEYFDHCVCCLFETRTSSYSYKTSEGVLIPDEYIETYFKECKTNPKLTVGKVIAATKSDVPHNDWFKAVGSHLDRKTQILTGLKQFDSYLESTEANRTLLQSKIVYVKDFPKSGIMFKHVLPLFAKHETRLAMRELVSSMELCPDYVLGVESRGFILGELVANEIRAGFLAARKPGKLPVEVYEESYEKEYGTDKLCIEKYDLTDKSVIIVDDLLATGNTALAAARLARRCGATVTFVMCITAVPELLSRTRRMLRTNGIEILLMI